MAVTKTSLRQIVHRDKLDQLTTDANYQASPAGGKPSGSTEADNLLTSVNSELTPPLRMMPTDPTADRVVHIEDIEVTNPDTGKVRTAPLINKVLVDFSGATITLPSTADGASDIVVSAGDNEVNYSQTASTFVKCGVWLNESGNIVLTFGSEGGTVSAAGTPTFEKKTQFIGYFVIETDGSQNIQNVEFGDIYQASGGGSGGSGIDKWESSTKYQVDDVVWYDTDRNIYVCTSEHTSTASFDETKFELLTTDGYSATLGETIAVGDSIYISVGDGNGDTGRTQGYAYKLDVTDVNRSGYAGVCVKGGNSSDVGVISTGGSIKGFTSLPIGQVVYGSATTPGSWQSSKPTTVGHRSVILGIASDASHLIINGALSTGSTLINYSSEDADTIHLIKSADLSSSSDIDLSGNNTDFDGGGSIAGNISLSSTAADLLLQGSVIKYTANGSDGSDDYFGFTKSIPVGQRGRNIGFQFNYKTDSTTEDDDFRFCVKIKDGAQAGDITTSNIETYSNTNNTGAIFITDAYVPEDCTEVEFGWQNTDTTTTVELYVDNILVSQKPFQEANILDEQTLQLDTANGYGSTGTKIRRFTTTSRSNGSGLFTYDDSSTDGASFTLSRDAFVYLSYTENFSSSTAVGISVDASSLSTDIMSTTPPERLASGTTTASGESQSVSWSGYLSSGSVIRPHTNGAAASDSDAVTFTIHALAETAAYVSPAKAGSQTYYITQTGNALTNRSGEIEYNLGTATIENETTYGEFIEATDDSGNTRTKFVALKPCIVDVSFSSEVTSSGYAVSIYKNGTFLIRSGNINTASYYESVSFNGMALDKGEYFSVGVPSNSVRASGSNIYMSFSARPKESTLLAAIPTPKTCYLKDVKAADTEGGTFTSGAWRTRVLNVLNTDGGTSNDGCNWCTLDSNQFTLPPGDYKINAIAPAHYVQANIAKLYNITDSEDVIIGTTNNSNTSMTQTPSFVSGAISISKNTTFEIQHICKSSKNGNGFGVDDNSGFSVNSIYTTVEIERLMTS